jgi:hypothetical protein
MIAGLAAAFAFMSLLAGSQPVRSPSQDEAAPPSRAVSFARFIGGGAIGLLAHEGGHLLFDVVFDAQPGVRRVDFHGIPFFAITHRSDLSPGREFTVSSAGFWVQHAGSEWLLARRPRLRFDTSPLAKGLLAFNVLASVRTPAPRSRAPVPESATRTGCPYQRELTSAGLAPLSSRRPY